MGSGNDQEVPMGTRMIVLCLFAVALSGIGLGCSLQRNGTGCSEGTSPDSTHRCVALDGSDAQMRDASMDDADIDAGPDAGPRDAGPDTHVDAFVPDGGDEDGGPFDGGDTDGGMIDAGMDGGTDAGTDAGPPPPLHIIYTDAGPTTGIAFRIVWFAAGRQESGWYFAACDLMGGTDCRATAPELAPSRMLQFYPFDASGGTAGCTFATCPTLCTGLTCPGFPGGYTVEYQGMAVSPLVLQSNALDTNGDMFGDRAYIEGRLP